MKISIIKDFRRRLDKFFHPVIDTKNYWEQRYFKGGNSGAGSYGYLAEFKAEIINNFIKKKGIKRVIEFGCGDGNQLSLSKYPHYIGYDLSKTIIEMCKTKFKDDETKEFHLLDEYNGEVAELTLSLDVIFHLLKKDLFIEHMNYLFNASIRYVIIYSNNEDRPKDRHMRCWEFSKWIDENKEQWKLNKFIPNKFPYDKKTGKGSISDFYIYERLN